MWRRSTQWRARFRHRRGPESGHAAQDVETALCRFVSKRLPGTRRWECLTSDQLLPEGVYHWTATHPEWEGPVSAYAIDDGARLILIDPIAVPDDVRTLFGSREVVTVITSTWHERDAASLGFPVRAPAPNRPENQLVPATRYAIGDSLFGIEAYPGREGQLDLVLWSERIRAVIAGDTLTDLGNGLEIPVATGRRHGRAGRDRAEAAARQARGDRAADPRRARRSGGSRTRPHLIRANAHRRGA